MKASPAEYHRRRQAKAQRRRVRTMLGKRRRGTSEGRVPPRARRTSWGKRRVFDL